MESDPGILLGMTYMNGDLDHCKGIPLVLYRLHFRWYEGPKGIGVYSSKPDAQGNFISFHCRPAGAGARKHPEYCAYYKYVARTLSGRKKKKAAIDRAYRFAYGKSRRPLEEKKPSQGGAGVGYCMAEKKHVVMKYVSQVEAANGRKMIAGICPDCGTKVQKYGKLLDCPECGQRAEGKADDYICRACREAT